MNTIISDVDRPSGAKALWHYPEYHAWRMARARCHNPKAQAYARYGGRGIRMCARWRGSFWSFLKDMGPRPSSRHELDRTNNNSGYEPGNCKWVRRWENDRNRRSNRHVTYRGQRRLLLELCEAFNVWPDTARWRIRKGWSVECAVETPTRRKLSKRSNTVTTARTREAVLA
ncbi:MAG TPA: hypothetical protein VF595_17520 [Tepidisphaeraceae bacterium]